MRTTLALALSVGCAAPSADLNLVVVPHPDATIAAARAEVESIVLHPCGGGEAQVAVGYELDLLRPEPVPLAPGDYCGVGVLFAPRADGGALRLEGQTADGQGFIVDLEPGLAVADASVSVAPAAETALVLDLGLLLDPATLAALGEDAWIDEASPTGQQWATDVGDALVWYADAQDGRDVYIDLWPDFDLSIDASGAGCHGGGGRAGDHGSATAEGGNGCASPPPPPDGTEPGTGDDGDGGTSGGDGGGGDGGGGGPSGASSGGGCGGGGGCSGGGGGGGCSGGGGCGGGCSGSGGSCSGTACATAGFGPWWLGLVTLVLLRRRESRRAR